MPIRVMLRLVELAAKGGRRYGLMSTKTPSMTADARSACLDCIRSAAVCLPVHTSDPGACARAVGRHVAGPRTAHGDGALRVMRIGEVRRFERYHRELNRASWSSPQGAQILLGMFKHSIGCTVHEAVNCSF